MTQDMRSAEIGSVRQCLNDPRPSMIIGTPAEKPITTQICIDPISGNRKRRITAAGNAPMAKPLPAMRR